ncbi:hypothetical protein Tco_1453348, partial [Tanacetum coccineum]
QYKPIRRCNNYAVLQSIPCSPECKIVGMILLDHCLSHALTATVDVPTMYLQQFWRTVSKVPDTKDMIKFMLDTQQFTYTVDMFCDTLHLLVETLENPFVTPTNINTIEAFMNIVGYQGVVDKVSAFFTKNLAQPWQTMFKVFNRCLTTRTSGHDQTKINILQLFHAVLNQTHVDYAALLWSPIVYASPSVSMKKKQIVGEFSSPQQSLKITIKQKQAVEKDDDDSKDRIEPGSHKDNSEVVDDDDDKEREKQDGEIGALRRMCRHQGYMIQDMEKKCVTTAKFWETHNKIDGILHEVVPQISENEFKVHASAIIAEIYKNPVQSNVIHVHPTITTSTETESSVDLQYQLYLKMKRNLQDRADNIALWEALKSKFEKTSTSNTSCRVDDFHSYHDEHQDDDAPPKGEKIVKRSKVSKSSKSARGFLSKHLAKDSTTYVSKQQSQHQE